MGFFSWKCSKTKKSIPAFPYAGRNIKDSTVVMVLPDDSIVEGVYDGYGNIGNKDVYNLIAPFVLGRENADKEDVFNGKKTISLNGEVKAIVDQWHYDEPVLDGKSLNDLIGEGYAVFDVFDRCGEFIRIVRKSAYKGETYKQLRPSRPCPDQGYFY